MKDLLFGALGEGEFVFYRENKTLYKKIQELLQPGRDIALGAEDHALFSCDGEDCDFVLFDALMNLALDKSKKASAIIQKNILEMNRYHCHYHYLGYKINYNIFSLTKHLKVDQDAIKFFKRANFLYNENINGGRAADAICGINFITIKDCDFISNIKIKCHQEGIKLNNCNIYINSNFATLIAEAERLTKGERYDKALDLLISANNDLEGQHFKYHCIVGLNFFIKSICCCAEGDLSSARYFLQKAQEQEVKNPLNKYFNIFSEKYLYV